MTNILTKVLYWIAGLFGYSKPDIINTASKDDRAKTEQIFRGLPHLGDIMDIADRVIVDGNVTDLVYRGPETRFDLVFYGADYVNEVNINVGDVQVKFWGIDQTTLRMNYATRCMKLSLKAQEELPRAMLKAKNLRDRFIGTLSRIILVPLNRDNTFVEGEFQTVDSIGIAVEYELLDETRNFMAYFKNNEIKKKLHGAAITNDNAENAYYNAINAINREWKDNGSSLSLTRGKEPWDLTLNGCKVFREAGKPWATKAIIASEDFHDVMLSLLYHEVYKVRLGLGEPDFHIVMDPVANKNGYLEFSPVFKTDVGVLATAISAERLNKRL